MFSPTREGICNVYILHFLWKCREWRNTVYQAQIDIKNSLLFHRLHIRKFLNWNSKMLKIFEPEIPTGNDQQKSCENSSILSECKSKRETNLRWNNSYNNSPITDTCGEHDRSKNRKSLLKAEFSPMFTTSANSFGWGFTLKRLLPIGCAHPQAQTGAVSTQTRSLQQV